MPLNLITKTCGVLTVVTSAPLLLFDYHAQSSGVPHQFPRFWGRTEISGSTTFWAQSSRIPLTYRAFSVTYGTGNHPIFCAFIIGSGHKTHLCLATPKLPVPFFSIYFLIFEVSKLLKALTP